VPNCVVSTKARTKRRPNVVLHYLHKNLQFTHTPISLFIKVANSIKGFNELSVKSYFEMENKSVTLCEWLVAASPCPWKFDIGSNRSAESKQNILYAAKFFQSTPRILYYRKFGTLWKNYQFGFLGNFIGCGITFPDTNLHKVPEMGIYTIAQDE
jgi:hypothetical protein